MPLEFSLMDRAYSKLKEDDPNVIKKILNYLFLSKEQLTYTLSNLGEENFNEVSLSNITQPLYAQIENLSEGLSTQLSLEAGRIDLKLQTLDESINAIGASLVQFQAEVAEDYATLSALAQVGSALSQFQVDVAENYATLDMLASVTGVDGEVNAASIILAVNEYGGTVKISADRINLSGYVTVSSLGSGGSTNIDGSRITTGTISASRLNLTGYVTVSSLGSGGTTQIDGGRITSGTITAANIQGVNITGCYISGGTVEGATFLSDNGLQALQMGGGFARFYDSYLSYKYGQIEFDHVSDKFYIWSSTNLKLFSTGNLSVEASGYVYIGNAYIMPGTVNPTGGWCFASDGIYYGGVRKVTV